MHRNHLYIAQKMDETSNVGTRFAKGVMMALPLDRGVYLLKDIEEMEELLDEIKMALTMRQTVNVAGEVVAHNL